ncbi:MAG: ATP-binding protein [Terrimicrobiaceae bacterium]|nr:ATP-binding protein [Terrimicrobiaceae bacterium]
MTLRLCFPSEACELADVRKKSRAFLEQCGFTECETEMLVLAIDEACTNIIRHAYQNERRPVRMEMARAAGRLRVTLRDYGKPCDPASIKPRDLEDIRPGGVGVHIIRKVFDTAEYIPCARGTRLGLEKRMPAGW